MKHSLNAEESSLDNNHSHFLLVDDGTEGKYGGEIDFRASFQKFLIKGFVLIFFIFFKSFCSYKDLKRNQLLRMIHADSCHFAFQLSFSVGILNA